MIRLADSSDFNRPVTEETAVRIQSLYRAYGIDVSFIRFYADGVGGLLAVMDGVGLFSSAEGISEEWITFIGMNPDIRRLHCSAKWGKTVSATLGWDVQTGPVLRYNGQPVTAQDGIVRDPKLMDVYKLLNRCFPNVSPLDAWYPDVSHRLRHGCCRIACIIDGEEVVSTAMTVAESENAVVLGQVATAESHRRRGYAACCIKDLISRCKVDSLYILPLNKTAEKLYISLGFQPDGHWAELSRA